MGLGKIEKIQPILEKYLPADKAKQVAEEIIAEVLPVYIYPVDDLDLSALRKFWEEAVRQNDYHVKINHNSMPHISDGELHRVTQLRFHGLLAKALNGMGKQIPNMWIITKRAADFLSGNVGIPKKVKVRDNKVIAVWPEKVYLKDFKILKDFRATYEIVDGQFVKPTASNQIKLIN